MTPDLLRQLLDYHYWARDRVLDAVAPLSPEAFARDLGNSFGSVHATLVHVYSAEWAWLLRLRGESPKGLLNAADYPTLDAIRTAWTELEAEMRPFVDGLDADGARRVLEYRTFAGAAGASPVWQVLQHVVNHATYHRGQVTTMLRQLGAAAPRSQDLIAFYRERGL